jgi:hypothetical protein
MTFSITIINHDTQHNGLLLILPFEMRIVLYGIHLFNDGRHKHGSTIYMKRKEGGREQDNRKTERESV